MELHRSTRSSGYLIHVPYLALLANWGYVTEFGDISQLPPISIAALPLATAPDPSVQGGDNQGEDGKGDLAISPSPDALALPQQNQAEAMPPEDWLALDNHLYQLVKVIAPKVNKYEGGVD